MNLITRYLLQIGAAEKVERDRGTWDGIVNMKGFIPPGEDVIRLAHRDVSIVSMSIAGDIPFGRVDTEAGALYLDRPVVVYTSYEIKYMLSWRRYNGV